MDVKDGKADIPSEMGVQGVQSPAGARGVLAHSLSPPSGPQARQKHSEGMSVVRAIAQMP
jgi:hypothetical protein